MRKILQVLLLLQLWWGAAFAEAPLPLAPQQWVTDGAGFLSPATRQRLDRRLATYQQATGHQVLVWIGDTTAEVPLEDWTVRTFAAWKVGRKGMDDGVVLFILAKDQKLRMEVGYGLEGQLPDALASRIIREAILPRLKGGDRDGAVTAGTDQLLRTLGGETGAARPGKGTGGLASLGFGSWLLIGLLAVGFVALFITHPDMAIFILFSLLSGGRGGGGGGGGGGFSGGGGRSGGGGASGSW